jgi:hypothetical protein
MATAVDMYTTSYAGLMCMPMDSYARSTRARTLLPVSMKING